MRGIAALLLLLPLVALSADIDVRDLPDEAKRTLAFIREGGVSAYPQDGRIFANREGRLPRRGRGYYREYTVRTPGLRGRGARRIVAGHGGELFYTDDHYRSFQEIRQNPRTSRIRP